MSSLYPKLFEPGRIGTMQLKNRIVMPPMDGGFGAADGSVTQRMIDYYVERAKGGVGLIIIHIVCVDYPQGKAGQSQISIDQDKYIPGMARLAESIQDYGAKTVVQLHHAGRQTTPGATDGLQPVAPSPVPCSFLKVQPRELSYDEIQKLVGKFISAAVRVKKAGFDGVQLHGAHGYLIGQFMSPISNKRVDGYGGDLGRRMRFPIEIIKGIRANVGPDFPIMIRFSADEFIAGGVNLEEGKRIARVLEKAGVDALCVSSGIYATMTTELEPMSFKQGWRVYLAEEIKKVVQVPVTTVGVIRIPEMANDILGKGKADFVEIGRGLVADPEWPKKAFEGRLEDIRKCITCNNCIGNRVFAQLSMTCSQNPEVGHESEWSVLKPAEKKKKVMIVGGGPAGMEAARVATLRGHDVTIYEKEKELGTQLKIAAAAPFKDKINWVTEWLTHEINKLNIKAELGKEVDIGVIKSFKPDVLIIATGAEPIIPDIRGITGPNVVTYKDLLTGKVVVKGENIVVAGGNMVGCECALYLVNQGKKVTILEMLEDILLDMEPMMKMDLKSVRLPEANVKWLTKSTIIEISDKKVIFLDKWNKKSFIAADSVVMCLGSKAVNVLEAEARAIVSEVYVLGDAKRARSIADAKHDGAFVGRLI